MSLTDKIIDATFKILGKRAVWISFKIYDWALGINTHHKLVEHLEGMKKSQEEEIKLFTAEGDEQERLLGEKIKESEEMVEVSEQLNEVGDESLKAGILADTLSELYTREMFEEEKSNFSFSKENESLNALNQVIKEAKQGQFKHSLSDAMKRLEELTDFEMFRIEGDEVDGTSLAKKK